MCAFERAAVARVLALPELSTPPTMPAPLAGFVNFAGNAVPVVDVARLLGVDVGAALDPFYRHLLVVAAGGAPLCLLVDRVLNVMEADLALLAQPGEGAALNDCVRGSLSLGDATIYVLDTDRLLLAFERERIAELREAEQARLDQWADA